MQRTPFIFCRYSAQIDDDELDAAGLTQALTDIQGQYLPHGRKAEEEDRKDVVVMKPRRDEIEGEEVVTWAIGHRPGHRVTTTYDAANQEIRQRVSPDDHIVYSNVVAIPRLRALAISDRQSAVHMGGRGPMKAVGAAG